jgi:hypothetical protein
MPQVECVAILLATIVLAESECAGGASDDFGWPVVR